MDQRTQALLWLVGSFGVLAGLEALALRGQRRSDEDTAGRAVTNFGLGIAVMLANGLPLLGRIGAGALAQGNRWSLAHLAGLGWPAIFAVTLLLQSFVAYWVHRLMHAVPLLWRAHRVHHSDAHLDISTGVRNHPLELLLAVPTGAAVVLLLGAPVSVVIAVDTLLFAAALWQHADFPLPKPLERKMERALVTPRLHRTHHLPDRALHDGNYGDVLIVWDRLFGTLKPGSARAVPVGLAAQRARPDHLVDQLVAPLHPLHWQAGAAPAGRLAGSKPIVHGRSEARAGIEPACKDLQSSA